MAGFHGSGAPRVSYLSFDSLAEGVGASQVGRYVTRVAYRGVEVDLHTFEKRKVVKADGVFPEGVRWHVHRFGRLGSIGGVDRVLRGAMGVRGRPVVHARGDLSALSAIVGRPEKWIWDMRSFWREERLSMGMIAEGSLEDRVIQRAERAAAKSADSIIVLAAAAIPVMAERHGDHVAEKISVVSTCTDLELFAFEQTFPDSPFLDLLLPGSLNAYYDVNTMVSLVRAMHARTPSRLSVVSPSLPVWFEAVKDVPTHFSSAVPDDVPAIVAAHHATLCISKFDSGVSLRGRMPIKLGESLAIGRPVVVNRGLGDMDEIIARHGCGVIVEDPSDEAMSKAAIELIELVRDEETPRRCRAAAEQYFNLADAIDRLIGIYQRLGAPA